MLWVSELYFYKVRVFMCFDGYLVSISDFAFINVGYLSDRRLYSGIIWQLLNVQFFC